ncbi:hypothetical protein NQ315_005860 [Exocentrus adspersus]|uniref:Carboxylic ester hydrolase n=1 Tax=Exocentrus adspersus TaxID=1586481 RepID=A0AAV8VRG6_9CUCU|nr:hypothetical protein NQ315_005860 [Exocentrus adspersus]
MLYKHLITVSVLSTCLVAVFSENTVVTLPNGKIQGREAKSFINTTFYAFQEVPYAAPPVGDLRFKAPAPVKNWEGVLETLKNTKICIQGGTDARQNEDCLYLNVYTPVVPGTEANLPVLVFIHGGGFVGGSGIYDGLGPEFFMDTGRIVVVTINYRLGPFGFLSTEDDVIPGNNGLKDQRFALLWVQENIHLFGGDPKKVTIDGQSAGSASVSYLVFSKQSEGLFRAAIHESGTVLISWGYQRYARDIAYKAAAAIDNTFTKSNTSVELLELLQKVSARDLQDVANKLQCVAKEVPTKHINPGYIFAPVVESGEDGFLTELPYEGIEKGHINKVKMIIGMNSEESITQVSNLESFKNLMTSYDNDLTIIVNDDFHVTDEDVELTIGQEIRKIYVKDLFQDDLASSVRFISDCRYTHNIIRYAQLASQFADVYFYQFSYDGELGGVNAYIEGAESVAHSEELQYLWRNNRNQDVTKFPEGDVLTHKRLVQMWTNFVTDLDPTFEEDELLQNVTWPLVEYDNFRYLDIRDDLNVKTDPKKDTYKSWENIYAKYAIKPLDTL